MKWRLQGSGAELATVSYELAAAGGGSRPVAESTTVSYELTAAAPLQKREDDCKGRSEWPAVRRREGYGTPAAGRR